jgi:ATP-dependent helicase/nuclease subunit B
MSDLFAAPGVLTMPPAAPFLPTLAKALIARLDRPETPFALADALILLPTRRAARALGDAFLALKPETATLLPRIRTLGDLDPDEAGLGEFDLGLDVDPPIAPMARRFALARMIRARDKAAEWSGDPVAALRAADALARLLDSAELVAPATGGFDWSGLGALVQDRELARHWELSTEFLSIITDVWPRHLAALGLSDPGGRQRRGLEGLAARWIAAPPAHPVVLAGSTGAIPATRALMKVVAGLPQGCVVLPGLDLDLSDELRADAARDDQHPQRGLAQVLIDLGVAARDVRVFPGATETRALRLRRLVLNEALAPQAATADWRARVDAIAEEHGAGAVAEGLAGLNLLEAASEDEEAAAIALHLRAALEEPGATAALVTPDAGVARRVAAKLKRWDIDVDVSSGRPLGETPVGAFVRLVAAWMPDPAEPKALVALLAHPLACVGRRRGWTRKAASALQINALRGARKDDDLTGLRARLAAMPENRWRPGAWAKADGEKLVDALMAALPDAGPDVDPDAPVPLARAAETLARVCEALAARMEDDGPVAGADALWRGEAGEALARVFSDIMEHAGDFEPLSPHDVPRAIDALLSDAVVRPRGAHPRLRILGPLEARMLDHDRLVLAGLDEGVWPAAPPVDPFLSRPMRAALGLPPPETRIGLSAHDFAQLAAQPHVTLTRSNRRGDGPAVPSRWLWRLKTLAAGALGADEAAQALKGAPPDALDLLRALEPVRLADPMAARPMPRPPVAARPIRFSATQVERLLRDPYRLYGEQILRLRPLDPLGGDPSASERGTAVHAAVEIVRDWMVETPRDPVGALTARMAEELARAGFRGLAAQAALLRLGPTIAWLAQEEARRLAEGWRPHCEAAGECAIDTGRGVVTLSARADRIDVGPDGAIEIIDFKTGKPPTAAQVRTMMNAQLPLTAAIVARGGFPGIPALTPSDLRHVKIGGAAFGPVGAVDKVDVDWLIKRAEKTLTELFTGFLDPERPYPSKPRAAFVKGARHADPFDLLARRGEWAGVESDEGGE